MRKASYPCLVAGLLAFGLPASASLILHDTFSSSVGALPAGWDADNHSTPNAAGIAAKNNDLVATGSLAYPGLAESSGNRWAHDNSQYQYYRRTFTGTALAAGETVYYSFVLRVDNIATLSTAGGNANLIGLSGTTTTVLGAGVVASVGFSKNVDDASKFDITVDGDFRGPNHAQGLTLATPFSTGVPILVVASYTRSSTGVSNTSTFNFWINPDPSSFGAGSAPGVTITDTATNITNLQAFLISSATTTNPQPDSWSIDDLRIGTTWASVTPAVVPEPAFSALLVGLGVLGVTALRRRR